jgi:hypothetical protein
MLDAAEVMTKGLFQEAVFSKKLSEVIRRNAHTNKRFDLAVRCGWLCLGA